MSAVIQTIESVEPYGTNLSIVTTSGGNSVIANRKEDGSYRWEPGELVAYVAEGSILPDSVLKERGYWDEEKDRGLLDGGKRNRVKMKRLAGFESRGLLFRVVRAGFMGQSFDAVKRATGPDGDPAQALTLGVRLGDDVSEFFGIEEFAG